MGRHSPDICQASRQRGGVWLIAFRIVLVVCLIIFKMSIIAIVCCILALCFTLFCGVFVCLETMFSREKYKVYIEHLSPARKHIECAEKNFQVSDDRYVLVQEEIDRVERERSYKICMDRPSDIVSYPCRHCCTCQACSVRLQTCAVCRTPIEGQIKIFIC